MFGTLHWNSHTNEADFVERPYGSLDAEKISACNRCRAKKVKCNANDNGCGRCKRLGKTCTFSSTKRRGDRRVRKTSINIAQEQERSLDLSIQPWVSLSSKNTGREEGLCSDERSFTSSLPVDGNVDDSERGQQPLAQSSSDDLADAPTNFDLSFLAESGQQTSHQDGDDIFNLSLEPWPLFSTSLPSTHLEAIQPAPVRTSEYLPSPSLTSGDERPHYLPPTTQAQDLSLFEIDSHATPTPPHPFPLVSTSFSSQSRSGQSCQCLAAVVFAVEGFEASCSSGNRAELDSIVAYQKEAIKCCRSMLKCSSCMAKRENLVLLVFMTEKIVAACGRIVVLYRMRDGDRHLVTTSAASSPSKTDGTHSGSIMSACTGTSSEWQELLLGDYEISSPLEWHHLVRVLIFLQLRAVMDLLTDMKNMTTKVLGERQTASLVRAEIRVGELEKNVSMV